MPYWVMHKLESRLPGEININKLIYADDTTLIADVKEESEKIGLKLNIQKIKIMASDPITS